MPNHTSNHPDGSACLEGTRTVPMGFVPCCDVFGGHIDTCVHDLRYEWWPANHQWVIRISDAAGGGGVVISHCPHCGTQLPSGYDSGL